MTVNLDHKNKRKKYKKGEVWRKCERVLCSTIPLTITVRIAGPVTLFPSVTVILRSYPVVVNVEISWSSCIAPAVNENKVNMLKIIMFV